MRKQNLVRIVFAVSLVTGLAMASPVWADDTAQLKQQVQALQNRVNQLESQLASEGQVSASPAMPVYDQWPDPFTQMILMRKQMERNMHQAFADTGTFNPRMDMKQTDKQYIITMDIPGMDKDKINVETKQDMLIISGERRSDAENNGNQYYSQERSFGSFMQAILLPEDAKKDQIQAGYKNGVLTVTIERMKKEEKKPQSERITVK